MFCWETKWFGYEHSSKYCLCVHQKSVIQVWNYMSVSKLWQNHDKLCIIKTFIVFVISISYKPKKEPYHKWFHYTSFFSTDNKVTLYEAMNVISDSAVGGCSWIRDWITSYLASFLTDGRKLRVRYQPHKTRAVIHRLPIHFSAIIDEANCRMLFYQIEFQTE